MAAQRNLTNRKLGTLPVKDLRELARNFGVNARGRHGDIAARLLDQDVAAIDAFIQCKYREQVRERQENMISDEDLLAELQRVAGIDWGAVKGQLDRKI